MLRVCSGRALIWPSVKGLPTEAFWVLMTVASAVTLTDSLTEPSSICTFSVAGVSICSRTLVVLVRKPVFSTVSLYAPGAIWRKL